MVGEVSIVKEYSQSSSFKSGVPMGGSDNVNMSPEIAGTEIDRWLNSGAQSSDSQAYG